MSFHYLSLLDISVRIRTGALSPVAVTQALLQRIAALDGTLTSYTTVIADRALAKAAKAEEEIAAGFWRGPLHGVPIAVKDLCDTTYAPTAAGMYIHKARIPPANATAVDRLEAAGAIMLGKLSMTEGAFGAHHPKMPKPKNPWNAAYWTGSSSSGSGTATAAGLCYASLGSDTGGSIRLPTGACGLSGVKPTWGRVSRYGVCDLSESLDHLGPMTRTVADCAAILAVIAGAGADANDPTAAAVPVPDYLALISGPIRGLRIGVDEEWIYGAADPDVVAALKAALEVFAALGATIVPVKLPDMAEMTAAWTDICAVESTLAHDATYPSRKSDYGPEISGFLDRGLAIPAKALGRAQIYRDVFKGELAAVFEPVDAIICPVIAAKVPTVPVWDDVAKGKGDFGDYLKYSAPFNFSGSPAAIFQAGFDGNGLPVGIQLVGKHFSEALLMRAAHAFQTVTDWHVKHPPL
ncbi:MAG: amidase [Ancalomicrobiaceae bacterium]|nr:amidase [Ancalomicrobiaceae bacterium]